MVTKQEQLEWLAERHEQWPVSDVYVVMSEYYLGCYGACHCITKVEWQQERDKMSSKPEVDNSWHYSGELPPVGCACEYKPANDWVKCKVLFAGDSLYVLGVQEFEICVRVLDVEFRPLRTEREKAIEEMVKLIGIGWMSADTARDLAIKMLDAGYHK